MSLDEKINNYLSLDMSHQNIQDWSKTYPTISRSKIPDFFDNNGKFKPNMLHIINPRANEFQNKYHDYILNHPNLVNYDDSRNIHTLLQSIEQKHLRVHDAREQIINTPVLHSDQIIYQTPQMTQRLNIHPETNQNIHSLINNYLRNNFRVHNYLTWTSTNPPFVYDYLSEPLKSFFYIKKNKYKFDNSKNTEIDIIKTQYNTPLWNKYKEYINTHPNDNSPAVIIINSFLNNPQQSHTNTNSNFNHQNNFNNNFNNMNNIPADIQILLLKQVDEKKRIDLIRLYNLIEQMPNGLIKDQQRIQFKKNLKKFDWSVFIETYKLELFILFIAIVFIFTFGENIQSLSYLYKTRTINDLKIALEKILKNSFEKIPKGTNSEQNPVQLTPAILKFFKTVKYTTFLDPFKTLEKIQVFLTELGPSLNTMITPISERPTNFDYNDTYYATFNTQAMRLYNVLLKIAQNTKNAPKEIIKLLKLFITKILKYSIDRFRTQI